MFGADGEVLQPSEVLHKKAVLVERGSFRPRRHVNLDMLECALAKFKADPAVADKPMLPLMEITMRNLLAGGTDVDRRDFLARAELLAACGDDRADFRLLRVLPPRRLPRLAHEGAHRHRDGRAEPRRTLRRKEYAQLPGGMLESFGRLFKNDLKLYVYPLPADARRRAHESTTSRSGPSSSRSTTTSPAGAASCTSTTTGPSGCPSSAVTCCGGSPRTTTPGKAWSRWKSPS